MTRFLFAALLALSAVAAANPDPQQARAMVESTAAEMQRVLQRNRAELEVDDSRINDYARDILLPTIDFTTIAKLVLGPHWRDASAAQRERFTEAFRELMVHTYSKALLEYVDAEVSYLPVKPSKRPNRVTVPSLVTVRGETIPLDYTVCHDGSEWKVCNIVIDKSINFIVNYRQQIGAEVQRGGLDRVIDELTRKQRG